MKIANNNEITAGLEGLGQIAWRLPSAPASSLAACALTEEHRAEVLAFLAERTAHTFGLAGFIHSNGLVSPHNRGTFYGCRDEEGQLVGVALIGHAILFEARSEAAIEVFARLAQDCPDAYMLLGEKDKVESFWHYYQEGGRAPRLQCRELLFEQRRPLEGQEAAPGLRLATLDDLDPIVPVHAQTVIDESGVDPLQTDPEGFRKRCARRIEKGRTWAWIEDGQVIFKAEVVTDTPEVVYLEGICVAAEQRGKGYGMACMSELSKLFLQRTASICILVNEKNEAAQAFYEKAGFDMVSYYDTIFLKENVH